MPSSGQSSIDMEEARYVALIIRDAIQHGLLVEWVAWYTGGIKDGLSPGQAALGAAIEWDF